MKFNARYDRSENLHLDVLLLSKAYKVSAKWYWRMISHDTEIWSKLSFCLKNDMRNLMNFNASSGKSKNFHFDVLILKKVCNVWAKKIQRSCAVKNDLWFQVLYEELGELLNRCLKVMWDKLSIHILAERMYILDKSSPSNFNFLDFLLPVWSCPNSSYDFQNQ